MRGSEAYKKSDALDLVRAKILIELGRLAEAEPAIDRLGSRADGLGAEARLQKVVLHMIRRELPHEHQERAVQVYHDFYQQRHEELASTFDGVREMLLALHQRFPLAVVSARDETTTRRFLDQFELTPLFSAVVCAQTCRRTKPFPDPVLEAARQVDIPVEACVMIGDTTVDMHA